MSTLYTPPPAPRRSFWASLGTPRAVQIVTVLMIVYALAIGALVFGYAQVSSCLASYADESARSTAARAQIAAEDRQLDLSDRDAQAAIELARDKYDEAWAALVNGSLRTPKIGQAEAVQIVGRLATATTQLQQVKAKARETRAANAEIRKANEEQRKKNPPPPPPSESC